MHDIYKTHTGLTLSWNTAQEWNEVILAGEREKLLYEGNDGDKARAVFEETKAHYEQRKEEETPE